MTWNTQFRAFFERLFGEAHGSSTFFTLSCITLGSLVLFSWIVTNFTFEGHKGLVRSFFTQALPGVAALLGWIGIRIYFSPHIQPSSPLQTFLPIVGGAGAALLVSCFTSRRLVGGSLRSSFISHILTYSCVFCAIYLGGALVRDVDSSLHQLEKRKEQRENDAQSIIDSSTPLAPSP